MGGRSRFELEKTYTSYAVTLTLEEFDALGREERREVKSKLRDLDLDLVEFDRQADQAYLYLRIAAEEDGPEMHAAIKDILEKHMTIEAEASSAAPGL